MFNYVKSPKRSTARMSDSSQFGNGYYQPAERVDDLESIDNMHHNPYQAAVSKNALRNLPEDTDIEEDLEGISVSSLSNLSECSIDWSEHNRTAKTVWIRHTHLNSDLNQAKERIREAQNSKKCSYSGQVGNDQNKLNYSEQPVEYSLVQQKHEIGNEELSSRSDVRTKGPGNNIEYKVKSINALPNNTLKAVSVDVDNPSKDKERKYGLIKRNWLMIGAFMLVTIVIITLIVLADKMGQVQESVQYIEDIFIDNVTFAETFSRFDDEISEIEI